METCMMKPKPLPKPVPLKGNDQERLDQPAPPRRPSAESNNNHPKPPSKPTQLLLETGWKLLAGSGSPSEHEETGEISSGETTTEAAQNADEDATSLINNGSGSNDDHWENSNEKGGFFSVLLQKSNKLLRGGKRKQDVTHLQTQTSDNSRTMSESDDIKSTESLHSQLSGSLSDHKLFDGELLTRSELLCESQTKERGGIFSGIFTKSPRQTETNQSAETKSTDTELLDRNTLTESKQENSAGLFGKILIKTPKPWRQWTETLANDSEPTVINNDELSESSSTKVKKTGLAAMFQRSASTEDVFEESKSSKNKKISASWDNLLEATTLKEEQTGRLAGIFKKSVQPTPCSNKAEELLSNTKEIRNSSDEKKVRFIGMFKRKPNTMDPQKSDDMEELEGVELGRRRTIKKKRRVVSFRIKRTLPQITNITSQTSDKTPIIEENGEMQNNNPAEESTIEVQPVEMAAYPTEDDPSEYKQESDELMEWWNTAKGWTEWNKMSNIQEQNQEMTVEEAADRVYLAARLFVHLFNQRGASLQRRILELLSLADAADVFHKKTVTAAVGGGVASVAGSVATITGLILAPFTFGASVIVTAVGISVATAGGITSATANITDTVHSRTDRKKVEKMIQGYQEEIGDIRECLEFVREGMDTLQEWDFEQYSQSAAKKALNHNIKHVVKEGGRAGKELMINTSTLISTVQLLGATGGAIKAAQVVSVTTGVMSALFLALDVFFLAKDSHELRKGAKTQFAAKIREVCKELQQGLLELNKVKTQLQKTMDGIEVEQYEEIQEVEVQIERDLESDPSKLAELEQELDLLEEKLDRKVEKELKKNKKETGNANMKRKEIKKKSRKEKGAAEIKEMESTKKKNNKKQKRNKKQKDEAEGKLNPEFHKLPEETEEIVKAAKDDFKEQSQEGSKAEKRIRIQIEKCVSKLDKAKKHIRSNKKTAEEAKSRSDDSVEEGRSRALASERLNTDRESDQRKRQETRVTVPEWKPVNKEMDSVGSEKHSSTGKHEVRASDKEKENDSSSSSSTERSARRGGNRREPDKSTELTEIKEESESKRRGRRKRDQGRSGLNKEPHRQQRRALTGEILGREESDSDQTKAMTHDQKERDEEQGKRVENMRRQFEREGDKVVNKRREDEKRLRRDRGCAHSRRGHGPQPSAELADGLYI